MSSVTRDKILNVSPQKLYQAIIDFEAYPKFIQEVVSAKKELNVGGTEAKVTFELEVMKRFQYILNFKMVENKTVEWDLVESDFFKVNRGKWELKELDSNKTEVHYELEVDFGFFVPKWISKKLTEVNLPKMFENFETHAKEI